MTVVGDDPLVIAKLGVKGALLQGPQLQGEPWTKIFQSTLLSRLKIIFMVAEEDVVPLVVEGHHPLAHKLGLIVEETGKHSGHSVTKPRGEVVLDYLWSVSRDSSVVFFEVSGHLYIAQLEMGGGAIGQVGDDETIGTSIVLVDNQDVCKTLQL